jgi:prepilin-type processing-associated H-X9-DG protein
MKTLAIFLALFLVLALATPLDVPVALVFGWFWFLVRVLPKVAVDWASVAVGCAAITLFIVGVQWLGRAWQRGVIPGPSASGHSWKLRWSLTIVVVICLLFVSGISVVGIVHQLAWLLTSERPLIGEGLKSSGETSKSQLKWVGNAFGAYHDGYGAFPPGGTFTPEGAMRHSWETHLLPYLGYSTQDIDLGRAWNDPRNETYFQCVVPQFINPDFRTPDLMDAQGFGLSHYAVNSRVLGGNKAIKLAEITDGPSTTLLVGEVSGHFKPWGHPANWRDPALGINRSPYGFGGPSGSGGATFLMADGSVRFVGERISPAVLHALSTPCGGEAVNSEALTSP